MVDEQVRVREQKPVAGVRIDDQVAFGRNCAIVNELIVGTITSLLPFATSAGCLISAGWLYAESPIAPRGIARAHDVIRANFRCD